MKKYIILLIVSLSFNACTPATQTAQQLNLTETPLASGLFPKTPPITPTVTQIPLWNVPEWYVKVEIKCETYIETTWGNGPTQWGYPATSPHGAHDLFPHLAFNQNNDFYLLDIPNYRLLEYDGQKKVPIQTIPLSETYSLNVSTPFVNSENIFVSHTFNRISIFSLDGQETKNLQIPISYLPFAPIWNSILVDSQGGIFVNGEKLVYFDNGWENGVWNEVSSTEWAIFTPFIWKDYLVYQGNSLSEAHFLIYMRKIDSSRDFLNDEAIVIDTGVKTYALAIQLKTIDNNGWAYFASARYSIPNGKGQVGEFPEYIAGQIIQSSVAPDGTLYLIVYDREDSTVQPKIIKCRFPEDE